MLEQKAVIENWLEICRQVYAVAAAQVVQNRGLAVAGRIVKRLSEGKVVGLS